MDWRLINDDDGEPQIQTRNDGDLVWDALWAMRLMARFPGSGLIEVREGIFIGGNLESGMDLLAQHDEFVRRMARGGR